jgi:hypothetical protein
VAKRGAALSVPMGALQGDENDFATLPAHSRAIRLGSASPIPNSASLAYGVMSGAHTPQRLLPSLALIVTRMGAENVMCALRAPDRISLYLSLGRLA